MFRQDFCVFILSHGRAANVKTYDTIRRDGYTGKIYIVIDDLDKQQGEYISRYGNEVLIFDKQKYIDSTDSGDNFPEHGSPVYARNAIWDLAAQVGVEYFVALDDDYQTFEYKFDDKLKPAKKGSCEMLDAVFDSFISFLEESGIDCVAMAQGGDFIGGAKNNSSCKSIKPIRKIMNSFFCKTSRRFEYLSKLNDDVNTYLIGGNAGKVFLTSISFSLVQGETQQNEGGITDLYKQFGTYVKSFYSVMYCPSFVTIKPMGDKRMRLHHSVSWNNAVPKIVREGIRKKRDIG